MKVYFKTIDEQINILKNRGLEIKDIERTRTILLRYNYFKIINATSKFFQEKVGNNIKYRKGTNFQDLVDIHNFDKDLKKILLPRMLEIERIARSIISYKFVEKYPYDDAYINPKYYSKENKMLVMANINSIEEAINRYVKENNFNRSMQHYLDKYNSIPFWFVINFISFGKLVNIYETLDYKLKEDVADEFQLFLEENLGHKVKGFLTPHHLLSFLNNAKDIRNLASHDNLIIGHKFDNIPYFGEIYDKYDGLENIQRNSLFDTIIILKALLPREEYVLLFKEITYKVIELRKNVDEKAYNMIVKEIGLNRYE